MAEILDGSSPAKQWIAAHFSPSVLVLTTAKVDQLCSKNGLDFADLIRPFGRVSGVNGTCGPPVVRARCSSLVRHVCCE